MILDTWKQVLFQDGVLLFMSGFGGSASLNVPDIGVRGRRLGSAWCGGLELLAQACAASASWMGTDWGAEPTIWGQVCAATRNHWVLIGA